MTSLRRALWLILALAGAHGIEACAADEPSAELNPQPLPPSEDEKGRGSSSGSTGGEAAGGTSSSGGAPTGVSDGDAGSDAGGDGAPADGGAD